MRRPIYHWLEAALYLFLIYLLVASGITYATWQYSIWQSEDAIRENPGFVQRLSGYARVGDEWGQMMEWVSILEPVNEITDFAEGEGMVKNALVSAIPLGAEVLSAIQSLDLFVNGMMELQAQANSLENLNVAAHVVNAHAARPTKNSLKECHDAFIGHITHIRTFRKELDGMSSLVTFANDSFGKVVNGIGLGQIGGNARIRELVEPMSTHAASWQTNVNNFTASLTAMRDHLEHDLATMETIIENTQRAQRVERLTGLWIMQPLIARVSDHLLLVTLFILVGLLLRRNVDRRW